MSVVLGHVKLQQSTVVLLNALPVVVHARMLAYIVQQFYEGIV